MNELRNGLVRVVIFAGAALAVLILLVLYRHESYQTEYRRKGRIAIQDLDTLKQGWKGLVVRVDTLEAHVGKLEGKVDRWLDGRQTQ